MCVYTYMALCVGGGGEGKLFSLLTYKTKDVEKKMDNLDHVKKKFQGVPAVAKQKRIHLGTMRLQVRFLASLSRLRIQR